MEYTLRIQDPSNPASRYLYEAIVEHVLKNDLKRWRGIFAFATGQAVRNLLIDDDVVGAYVRTGRVEILVGIDAVTDAYALEQLAELNELYPDFEAKVFFNTGTGLFHPKISRFDYGDGSSALIVGSGNLTRGGLRRNIEAYSVAIGTEEELTALSTWDEFLVRHAESVRDIDDEAMERVRKNRVAAVASTKPQAREAEPEDDIEETELVDEPEPAEEDSILVARVPAAGGRWHQVHFNRDIVERFFRIIPQSEERAFMREVRADGTVGPEEVRPLVFTAGGGRNYRIEIAAGRGKEYPDSSTPPIIVFREVGVRSFRYMLLMPGDDGYERLMYFTETRESVGRGLRRTLTNYRSLIEAWPDCPL